MPLSTAVVRLKPRVLVTGRRPAQIGRRSVSLLIFTLGLFWLGGHLFAGHLFAQEKKDKPKEKAKEVDRDESFKPLLNEQELKVEKRFYQEKTTEALRSLEPTPAQLDALKRGAIYVLKRQTTKSEVTNLGQAITRLRNDLTQSTTSAKARGDFLKAFANAAQDIYNSDEQPMVVRMQCMVLLTTLDVKAANPATNRNSVPYTGHFQQLFKVLQNDDLPMYLRVGAARGLVRIAADYEAGTTNGDLSAVERSDLGLGFVEALKLTKVQEPAGMWLRRRCVEGLGAVGLTTDATRRVVFADVLLDRVRDPKEELEVRTRAARALSILNYPQAANLDVAIYETVKLHQELLTQYNKDPNPPDDKKKPKDPRFKVGMADLYFAFRPERPNPANPTEGWINQTKSPGLAKFQGVIDAAYGIILKPAKDLLNATPKLQQDYNLDGHKKFLKDSVPNSPKLVPESRGAANTTVPATNMGLRDPTTSSEVARC